MPPKISITKDMILEATFSAVEKHGMDCINARYIAKMLDCSTQPIFRAYKNMDELKQSIVAMAEAQYNQKMMEGLSHKIPFFGMGLAYIHFAAEHPQLFHLLFLDNRYTIFSFDDMMNGADNEQIVNMLAQATGGTKEQGKRLYVATWLLTHGIATMLATNQTQISDTEIETILWDGYLGFKKQIIGASHQ